MRYISLFSGIEAVSYAWKDLDLEPIAFSEVDQWCSALLAHHYPTIPNLGDITKVDFTGYAGKCDLIVGGSPCTSYSISGKREGRRGQSGLMSEYIRAVQEIRPKWTLWENVPGALSVEDGAAFRQLITELGNLGYGLAWRVLDAQFFGVAQQRRRLFLIGCLGDPESAGEVLFEPESMQGVFKTSAQKRQEIAEASRECVHTHCYAIQGTAIGRSAKAGPSGAGVKENDVCYTLTTRDVHCIVLGDLNANTAIKEDSAPTLKVGGDGLHLVASDSKNYIVRKLTPKEYERLQGFCDDYTLIEYKGALASDAKRYKALGNSMATPVMRWLAERILSVENSTSTSQNDNGVSNPI